jgi:hypothetical protein
MSAPPGPAPSEPGPRPPRTARRRWPQRLIIVSVVLAALAAVVVIGLNAVRLISVNAQVQARSASTCSAA